MYDEKDNQYVEAIKLAAGGVQYRNLSVKKTLIEAVEQLHLFYKNSLEKKYLEVAKLFIQAYLELGFSYQEGEHVFSVILDELGECREVEYSKKIYVERRIKLNKSQVRSMIKRWPASPHQTIKIEEVVEDIINKVKSKAIGIYYYECAVTKDVYELVINENEVFFHDLKRGVFFTLLQ
ncbi:MAG: hypothetical protein IJZ53_04030 [Tyzzerella sp.]|nr:hypothetical protein [Tyzzerella sp.]